MTRLQRWLDRSLYPAYSDDWDDVLFRTILLKRIGADSICLDYGAGRGNVAEMNFKGVAAYVAGVDLDSAVFQNPYLDEANVLEAPENQIPHASETFDVVFSDNVMEHVQDPLAVLREVARVLKPGGVFLAKTPNKLHYMPLIARFTPTWFHRFYNRLRGRDVVDTFPTLYRCNTEAAVRHFAEMSGLSVELVDLVEGRPEYLRLFFLTYLFGFLYERFVNSMPWLARFRSVLIFELRRSR